MKLILASCMNFINVFKSEVNRNRIIISFTVFEINEFIDVKIQLINDYNHLVSAIKEKSILGSHRALERTKELT